MSIQKAAKIVRDMRHEYKDLTFNTDENEPHKIVRFVADFNFLCGYILALDNHEIDMPTEVPAVPQEPSRPVDSEWRHATAGAAKKQLHRSLRGAGATEAGTAEGDRGTADQGALVVPLDTRTVTGE